MGSLRSPYLVLSTGYSESSEYQVPSTRYLEVSR